MKKTVAELFSSPGYFIPKTDTIFWIPIISSRNKQSGQYQLDMDGNINSMLHKFWLARRHIKKVYMLVPNPTFFSDEALHKFQEYINLMFMSHIEFRFYGADFYRKNVEETRITILDNSKDYQLLVSEEKTLKETIDSLNNLNGKRLQIISEFPIEFLLGKKDYFDVHYNYNWSYCENYQPSNLLKQSLKKEKKLAKTYSTSILSPVQLDAYFTKNSDKSNKSNEIPLLQEKIFSEEFAEIQFESWVQIYLTEEEKHLAKETAEKVFTIEKKVIWLPFRFDDPRYNAMDILRSIYENPEQENVRVIISNPTGCGIPTNWKASENIEIIDLSKYYDIEKSNYLSRAFYIYMLGRCKTLQDSNKYFHIEIPHFEKDLHLSLAEQIILCPNFVSDKNKQLVVKPIYKRILWKKDEIQSTEETPYIILHVDGTTDRIYAMGNLQIGEAKGQFYIREKKQEFQDWVKVHQFPKDEAKQYGPISSINFENESDHEIQIDMKIDERSDMYDWLKGWNDLIQLRNDSKKQQKLGDFEEDMVKAIAEKLGKPIKEVKQYSSVSWDIIEPQAIGSMKDFPSSAFLSSFDTLKNIQGLDKDFAKDYKTEATEQFIKAKKEFNNEKPDWKEWQSTWSNFALAEQQPIMLKSAGPLIHSKYQVNLNVPEKVVEGLKSHGIDAASELLKIANEEIFDKNNCFFHKGVIDEMIRKSKPILEQEYDKGKPDGPGRYNKIENLLQSARRSFTRNFESILSPATFHPLTYIAELILISNKHPESSIYFTGIGKNQTVAEKTANTFRSLGFRAHSINPVSAMHGDMGMITENDLVIAISKSGETLELNNFLEYLRKTKNTMIIGLEQNGLKNSVHNGKSSMGKIVHNMIELPRVDELGKIQKVPTMSTILMQTYLDIIAIHCAEELKYSESDFVKNHPGGKIGSKKS